MEWPDPEHVEALVNAGGMSGAELDVLSEFLSMPVSDWRHFDELETAAADDESDCLDTQDDRYAEHFPTAALIRRVNEILQNHR